jgi:hypothetical protein
MKKSLITLLLVMLTVVTFGQQWVAIKSDAPSTIQTTLVASTENQITVNMQVPGFYTFEVTTPRGEANIISVPRTVSTAAAGEPDLPMIAIPAIIGDRQHYSIRLVDAQYTDFPMEVAPSKGDFPRSINPDDVPYTYGEAYSTDAFFPAQNVGLYDPYILRDFRGQNMVFYPFAYNPVTHTLRVYYNMTVEMYSDGQLGENTLSRRSSEVKMDPEFGALYQNHFINYREGLSKYNAVDETGELLIICHDAFMNAMQPFVNWKKQIGRPVTMVGTSVSGATSEAIKTYIQNQYNSNPNISHILLVGDNAQVQSYYTFSGGYSGRTDQYYGQLVGNDYYNDVIVGRFSAENADHVTTQVDKVIHYERDVTAADTWLSIGQGVSKNEGAGSGHFGEADYQHIDYIRDTLLHYNYTSIHRDYQNVQGVSSSAAIISQHINEGVSIINYCNHGSPTSWGVFGYSNSHINALTNDNKLPFIWSVACNNGQLDYSQPCFAEAWMRATNNSTGAPTGAIGGMFSYISQPWQPPMYGQDEMNNVLTEHRSIKRTLGGISTDGNMKILDQYNSNGQGLATYQFWLLFGDPTLTVRNMTPANMNVTHASSMSTSATSFTVNATNGNGALATLTRNNEIMGSATINNGTCNITFAAPGTTGTATLTVFGYNKITYIATIQITGGGTQQYTVNVSANPTIGGSVTGGGTYNQGQSCTVTATPNAGYTFTNWTENGNVVSSQANYTFVVNNNRTLVANFQVVPQNYTITVSANPTNGGSVTGGGTFQEGQSCTVSATANTGYTFSNWTENGNVVSTQASYTFTVNGNRTLVANFTAQQYTITATADPVNGGNVTGGGTFNYGNSCTLSATPTTGYTFVNWTKNGSQVSTDATYTFNVTESATYVAHFQLQSFTVNVTTNPAEGGTVAGGGTFNYGETCTVIATANEGYEFVNWVQGLLSVSDEASYTFTVTCNVNLTANFALQIFEVKVSVNPTEAGTVTGEGTYNYGDEVTLAIIRNEDWAFENWTENGEVVSEELTYTFTITSNRDLEANFTYTEGIGENNIETKVYPNPTKGEFTLEGEGLSHVRIVNAYGQTVYNADLEGEQVCIDLSNVAKGIYMMQIEAEGGQTVRKIVVE